MSASDEPSPEKDTDGPSPPGAPEAASSPPAAVKKELGLPEMSNGKVGDSNPEMCAVSGSEGGGGGGGAQRRAQSESAPKKTAATSSAATTSPPAAVKKEQGTPETSNGKARDPNPADICVVVGGNEGGLGRGRPGRPPADSVAKKPSPISATASPSPTAVKREPPETSNGKVAELNPAEICVLIGGSEGGAGGIGPRRAQAEGMFALGTPPPTKSTDSCIGSYVCGVCGKKYKYYNCFQTHVRAHRESEGMVGETLPQTPTSSFRYSCDICGKKYKYYSCFQEHRDLHAVDDPYEQVMLPVDGLKEEPVEPYQKIGPKSGSYVCEFCGKQYKYFNPYQEHVALHTPLGSFDLKPLKAQESSALDISKFAQSQASKLKNSPFRRKLESTFQSSLVDTNSLQNSSGAPSPLVASSFSAAQKPFTCGACGIQFQFYSNLLEHMQSHEAHSENHTKGDSPKTSSASGPQEQLWRGSQAQFLSSVKLQIQPQSLTQRNHTFTQNNGLPEKERQQVAERLLRVMCSDLNMLSVINSKDFLKLAQTLVDTGARHGAYSTRDALGNMSALALRQLPRMYNQVKVKVTCALGSNASLGIAVTCHSHMSGPDACYVLTAYQVEGPRLKRYVLGVREVELREGPEQVHHWVQNVLSEFVMSEIRTVYVSEPRVWAAGIGGSPLGGSRGRICLRCAGCSLGAVVQAVLGKRSLQARGLHDLAELLSTCRDIASSTTLALREEHSNTSTSEEGGQGSPAQCPTPPCWDRMAEALLQVHAHFEQICEAYGRSKATAPLLQGLNKHLLSTLACLLAPLRLAALELSSQRRPTLQQVLPVYLRLEKFFTSKAGEAGTGTASKLCHYFLEALKENFKVERAHQVAMVLDPQLKLRSVPAYQHEDIISRACEMAAESRDGGLSGGVGTAGDDRDCDGPPMPKISRVEGAGSNGGPSRDSCTLSSNDDAQGQVRQEIFQYLAEPLLQGTPDLFQYWSTAVTEKFPKLARLALWLLAVPAVAIRSECVTVCEQSMAMKRRQQVTAEEMNKLIFLRSNLS
ncbi:zinc finger protein 618 isoform X1 [Periophthalmus magnuspinnatus]|uniref:zinc finger protein 618 isoform X1 n=1 Tax=Periophthalmus magnuspinnatus TaxID=409849 RepID=UPI0024370465|nr:zinc finger protein 618 isoform X1 [Periophthalmus magnuspinnatus]XP_055087602.1 zinc finger protein 618 isoform X1 [Periophthalmus magnuspinnatus]